MPATDPPASHYVGRFAPSPTGPLHFGSLLGGLASFLDARACGGRWLVRIEDLDPPRELPGAAQAILHCLQSHGLHWDGDVLYQSARATIYRAAAERLLAADQAFYCTCSRSELATHGGVYTGRCRAQRHRPAAAHAVRVRAQAIDIGFDDLIQGHRTQRIDRDPGDFVIMRKEQLAAYQLAVVVDDALQGVTRIVRGSDLLDSTPRQIFLQHCLQLPTPAYAHIPVIANAQGQKLSKQTLATALPLERAAENLLAALQFLGQPAPPADCLSIGQILRFAIAHWEITRVPRRHEIHGDALPPLARHFAA